MDRWTARLSTPCVRLASTALRRAPRGDPAARRLFSLTRRKPPRAVDIAPACAASRASARRLAISPCSAASPHSSKLASADPKRLAALAARSGLDRFRLQRLFRKLLGLSPRAYADAIRLRRLKAQLRKGDDVTTALYDSGYGSSSRLYERSNAQLGMTPATYGRRGAGVEIGYTIAVSPAGRLLVAGTERGICAVYLGDRDATLQATLHREFPEARIRHNSKQLSSWVRTIVSHLAGRKPHLELPLDIRATAFQRRVWEALQRIPYGKTCSYSEIARALGQPRAARAVARACATNPVSVVIPCHRVVREGGGLGGYRWGLARKQALLNTERSASRSKNEE